ILRDDALYLPFACHSIHLRCLSLSFAFFFLYTSPPAPEIYTLSLHDALPIWSHARNMPPWFETHRLRDAPHREGGEEHRASDASDRKSTRLNSSHRTISYAVFCLKKKIEDLY